MMTKTKVGDSGLVEGPDYIALSFRYLTLAEKAGYNISASRVRLLALELCGVQATVAIGWNSRALVLHRQAGVGPEMVLAYTYGVLKDNLYAVAGSLLPAEAQGLPVVLVGDR